MNSSVNGSFEIDHAVRLSLAPLLHACTKLYQFAKLDAAVAFETLARLTLLDAQLISDRIFFSLPQDACKLYLTVVEAR